MEVSGSPWDGTGLGFEPSKWRMGAEQQHALSLFLMMGPVCTAVSSSGCSDAPAMREQTSELGAQIKPVSLIAFVKVFSQQQEKKLRYPHTQGDIQMSKVKGAIS